ncbi:hypothetical protein PF005_g16793 [Phytophthora fragariae]|uniref:Uncharacterized protein n=1 Tax=Phytophthora fragariae TaxID=53985 RepID=A0A6A3EDF6_9STRA|nr:hypothetical protein PF009_g18147 [Phytophthora fragariae]KAE8991647.1 hypothetical protein PF011_g17863 [Phytophthora fragariae]KAE9091382.1 hypothetical protein PF007_g18906 [Phytophthora fragariae]KAE9096482.1 hypothetical protein PF010_g16330 [Phytophthora fragariae]KAE9114840.1 hypothetical protein PF006_g19415 [Phytophthora fragariae]
MRRACTLCLVVTYLSGNNLDRNMLKNLCIYYTGRAPFPVIIHYWSLVLCFPSNFFVPFLALLTANSTFTLIGQN